MDFDKQRLHHDCFKGKSDYIPLSVRVASNKPAEHTLWDGMIDPDKVIESFTNTNTSSLSVQSDWVPCIESNFLESLVPSLFGAQPYCSPGGLVDIRAFIGNIEDTADYGDIDIQGGQTEQAVNHLKYLQEHAPDGVSVLMSRFASPLDYAVMMRGGDFYLDLMLEPELAADFMNKIAEATIKLIKLFKSILCERADTQVTVRGFHFPGLRLTGDAVVNLSPDLIRKFMLPIYNRFASEFGSVMLHYCTSPAPAHHVLPVLAECEGILCVDNWHGYMDFFDKEGNGLLQNKVAICTDITVEQAANPQNLMASEPFFANVARKGGRGIAATVCVGSISEGIEIYSKWRDYFTKTDSNRQQPG